MSTIAIVGLSINVVTLIAAAITAIILKEGLR